MIGEKITKKRKKLFLTVLVVIALCTYASRQISSLCTPLVETITANEGSLDNDFEEQGNVKSESDIALYSIENLRVSKVKCKVGQTVCKGESLIEFDQKTISELQKKAQNEYNAAKASLDVSKATNSMKSSQAKTDYDNAVNSNNQKIAQAKQNLMDSQNQLNNYKPSTDDDAKSIAETKKSLQDDIKQKQQEYNDVINNAKIEIDNAKKAVDEAALPQQDEGTQKSDLEEKQDALNKINEVVSNGGMIKAPEDGIITEVSIKNGNMTTAEAFIHMASKNEAKQIEVTLNEQEYNLLNLKGKIKIYNSKEKRIKAELISVGPKTTNSSDNVGSADSSGASGQLSDMPSDAGIPEGSGVTSYVAILETTSDDVKISDTVRAKIEAASKSYQYVLDRSALRQDNGEFCVYVLEEKDTILGSSYIVKKVNVKVLDKNANKVAVSGDLDYVTPIVTTATKAISEGDKVDKK
ncbi:HlyD family efflux transporter periplasmic adaptor subunit [Lachnobacterium bovis]|uniref:HlyD family secretion protein n=1 Tax=Lachnobacterium bovis TaxID=140626 RepID=A0A1H9SPC8_9FIRM|nr:HlyD family efflux transporter periplasmic adaptor subunit [Lachnobacterium bovis]SER86791.1 HlyD family secretion protein [Lachnobacterium bovis]